MTQPQGPQPDPQSNQQPNMGPNPNLGAPPPQIMYVEKPKRPGINGPAASSRLSWSSWWSLGWQAVRR